MRYPTLIFTKGETVMKKSAYIYLPFSILTNAAFFSLGISCLLNFLGIAMAISLDSGSGLDRYPRFAPFCIIVGILSLVCLFFLLFLNVKHSEKLGFTKAAWLSLYISSFILSFPMLKLWENVFVFLQKTF